MTMYSETQNVKGIPPTRTKHHAPNFFVNGIYKIKPLNFLRYAKCRIVNVLRRTAVVEILETHDEHDENLARELSYRTVALYKDIGRVIEVGKNAYLKSFGEDVSHEFKTVSVIMYNPHTDEIKRFKSMYELRMKERITTQTVEASIQEERPILSGKRAGYRFFKAGLSDKEIREILAQPQKESPKKGPEEKPVYVKFLDGSVKRYESAKVCGDALGTVASNITSFVFRKGKPITKGKFKGMYFSREDFKQ